MKYDEVIKHCEALKYRDKLRLAQLLLQTARKEEEIQNSTKHNNTKFAKPKLSNEDPTEDSDCIMLWTE